MTWKVRQILHSTWEYLNQPIFDACSQSVWKPSRFWYLYKIRLLEACWHKDSSSESHSTQ